MAPSADLKAPRPQKSRSRSNCVCGGPCFYCAADLADVRHQHDHFPMPWRHGGRQTVPACGRCHSLKDRVAIYNWPPSALEAADAGLTHAAGITLTLILRAIDLRHDWWVTDDSLLPFIVETVDGCTTTEARICMATAFNLFLDAFPPNDDGPALGEAVEATCAGSSRLDQKASGGITSPVALRLF